ncbi:MULTISPECIES: ISAs1 family transposase [Pelosinus]|uniref:Transposase IS4 family protein n=1 Tax=Pelosinus fermentans B4 TaxID=1149862 RepID=I9LA42_9FIRM|nr:MULTISPECIES: ISAs1 family transposase [Pelosinus]EIW17171.1 transposase IS4 family protein [Pelosinus fermentans B4]EIW23030.1 transposase IS4 family protein [Pelosinus fermentans A11]OAM93929.1 transposase IS4 family protein [Pelosinus fermentans DSM 17108]SDQ94721.1 DDE_Tnp_1-associated [Pelosinus fermentans]
MDILNELQRTMLEVERESEHKGYWYRVSDILTILICGMLCSLQTIDDIHEWSLSAPAHRFLEEFFGIKKIPSRAQFYNILSYVDSKTFNESFIKWMQIVLHGNISGKTVAIDGKTIRSTDKLTKDGSILHIASAIVSEHGLVIGSRECGTKTGEITAFRELIEMLDVKGAVVVADALHCNHKSAEAVVAAGADYLFVVKDNVPTLKEDIALFVKEEKLEKCVKVEKNGGRIEKRTAYACCEIDWLDGHESWKNLQSIGAIHTEFEKGGKLSSEWHYYISSIPLTAESLLHHARLEWGIESMHWLLDVHFAEDKTRVWDMNVQKTLNIMRKIALNLAKDYKAKTKSKLPISGQLKRNLFDVQNLSAFLTFFTLN